MIPISNLFLMLPLIRQKSCGLESEMYDSNWSDRQFETPHAVALKFMQFVLPIKDSYCCPLNARSFFQKAVTSKK